MRNVSKGRAEAHMSRSRGCPRGGGRFRRRRTTKPYASRVGSGRSGLSVARVERRSRSIPTPALRASRGVAPRAKELGATVPTDRLFVSVRLIKKATTNGRF